jgi:hypothetical protein
MRDAPNQIQGNDWVRHGLAPMMTTHPNLLHYEATLQIPETTFLPMRALLDPLLL